MSEMQPTPIRSRATESILTWLRHDDAYANTRRWRWRHYAPLPAEAREWCLLVFGTHTPEGFAVSEADFDHIAAQIGEMP